MSDFLAGVGDALNLLVIAWLLVGGGIGAALGSARGRAVIGFFVGLIPLVGWILLIGANRHDRPAVAVPDSDPDW